VEADVDPPRQLPLSNGELVQRQGRGSPECALLLLDPFIVIELSCSFPRRLGKLLTDFNLDFSMYDNPAFIDEFASVETLIKMFTDPKYYYRLHRIAVIR